MRLTLHDQLRNLTRAPDQTMTSYLIEIERLIDRLEPNMSLQSKIEKLIEKITDPEIKKELIVHAPQFTSFREAAQFVTRHDSAKNIVACASTTTTTTTSTTTAAKPLAGKVLSISENPTIA